MSNPTNVRKNNIYTTQKIGRLKAKMEKIVKMGLPNDAFIATKEIIFVAMRKKSIATRNFLLRRDEDLIYRIMLFNSRLLLFPSFEFTYLIHSCSDLGLLGIIGKHEKSSFCSQVQLLWLSSPSSLNLHILQTGPTLSKSASCHIARFSSLLHHFLINHLQITINVNIYRV